MPDSGPLQISQPGLLLITAGVALVVGAASRWDPVGPQSLLCRHRDDPKGLINVRVDVGRGEDRVRFADGQTRLAASDLHGLITRFDLINQGIELLAGFSGGDEGQGSTAPSTQST